MDDFLANMASVGITEKKKYRGAAFNGFVADLNDKQLEQVSILAMYLKVDWVYKVVYFLLKRKLKSGNEPRNDFGLNREKLTRPEFESTISSNIKVLFLKDTSVRPGVDFTKTLGLVLREQIQACLKAIGHFR